MAQVLCCHYTWGQCTDRAGCSLFMGVISSNVGGVSELVEGVCRRAELLFILEKNCYCYENTLFLLLCLQVAAAGG